MDSHDSCSDLVNLILNAVPSRKQKIPIILHYNIYFDGVYSVFKAQTAFGWHLFLDSCLSYEWAKVQQIYLDLMGSRKGSKKWVAGLIRKI